MGVVVTSYLIAYASFVTSVNICSNNIIQRKNKYLTSIQSSITLQTYPMKSDQNSKVTRFDKWPRTKSHKPAKDHRLLDVLGYDWGAVLYSALLLKTLIRKFACTVLQLYCNYLNSLDVMNKNLGKLITECNF